MTALQRAGLLQPFTRVDRELVTSSSFLVISGTGRLICPRQRKLSQLHPPEGLAGDLDSRLAWVVQGHVSQIRGKRFLTALRPDYGLAGADGVE